MFYCGYCAALVRAVEMVYAQATVVVQRATLFPRGGRGVSKQGVRGMGTESQPKMKASRSVSAPSAKPMTNAACI
jgi:hypothetical protein